MKDVAMVTEAEHLGKLVAKNELIVAFDELCRDLLDDYALTTEAQQSAAAIQLGVYRNRLHALQERAYGKQGVIRQ